MRIQDIVIKAMDNASRHPNWRISWEKNNDKMSIGDALALCHSELSEALDAYRHNNFDNFKEELADEVIRICHMAGELNIDLNSEIKRKMNINLQREVNHGRKNL